MKPKKTKLKNKLLELVLIYAKIKKTDDNWWGNCCTCGWYWPWRVMCWWHFIPQVKWLSTKFELDNVNLQCIGCNGKANQWEQYKHWLYIDEEYWEGRAEELRRQSRSLKSRGIQELEDAIDNIEKEIIKLVQNNDERWKNNLIIYIKKNSSRKAICKNILETI